MKLNVNFDNLQNDHQKYYISRKFITKFVFKHLQGTICFSFKIIMSELKLKDKVQKDITRYMTKWRRK